MPVDGKVQSRKFVGQNPFLAGWGLTKQNGKQSTQLLQVQLPVMENKECDRKYRNIEEDLGIEIIFGDHAMCAGFSEGGRGSCHGDSGGPFMLPVQENGSFAFYQIGVLSGSIGCAQPNIPVIFSSVGYYADWIKAKLLK